jgi:hypothetical protein
MNSARFLLVLGLLAQVGGRALGQSTSVVTQAKQVSLTESGQVVIAGKSTPYLIHHLPVNSFPELPAAVAEILDRRGCTIPQTYEAHRPENVVHASLEQAGSSDWAVLCSAEGTVSLLVFFDGVAARAQEQPVVLASAIETKRLQPYPGGSALGFNWGIDPASPEQIHSAQKGLENRPARVDHDALSDSVIEHNTIYHFYARSAWTVLPMPN